MEAFLCALVVVGVLIAVVWAIATSRQAEHFAELEAELARLRRRLSAVEAAVSIPPPPLTDWLLAPEAPEAPPETAAPPPVEVAREIPAEPAPAPEPPAATRPEWNWEELVGGRWMGWMGAVTVAIAVGLAVLWAYQAGWITPMVILSLGWLAGAGLLAGGEGMRRRLPLWAQGLAGGGVAALYLTTYAGHVAYGTLRADSATLGLTIIGVLAIGTAIRHDSAAIGWLGLVLAYGSPVLLGMRGSSPVPLFLYLTALNAAVLGISVTRRWPAFRSAAFGATALLFGGWLLERYSPAYLGAALAFTGVNSAVFIAVLAVFPLVRKEAAADADLALAVLNPLLSGWVFYGLLRDRPGDWLAVTALIYAAVYYALSRAIRLRRGTADFLEQVFFAAAMVFTLMIPPFYFKARAMAAAWSLAGAGLAVVGRQSGSRRTRAWSGAFLAAALLRLAFHDAWLAPSPGYAAFFNERGFSFAVVTLGLAVTAGLAAADWRRSGETDRSASTTLAGVSLIIGGVLQAWTWLDLRPMWVPPAWAAAAALALAFGWQLRSAEQRTAGLLMAVPPLLWVTLTEAGTLLPGRLALLAWGLGAALAFEYWRRAGVTDAERARVVPIVLGAAAAVGLTWTYATLPAGLLPLSWALIAGTLLVLGCAWGRAPLRVMALGAAVLLTSECLSRELTLAAGHPLLLHSRTLAAVSLIALWAACAGALHRFGNSEERAAAPWVALVTNAVALGWLSLEATSAAAILERRSLASEAAARFALSAVWIVYAAAGLAVGFVRNARAVRIGGIALLLAAVAKIYLVDLAALALGYRVISFLFLALVLLAVSYVYQRRGTTPPRHGRLPGT